MKENKEGSHKNIWYGAGRQRIEIPKTILKSRVQANQVLKDLHICSIGYYPKAKDHYTHYEVGPNEFFILPQNVEHSYGSDSEHPWSIYWIHFGGESLPGLNQAQAFQKHFKPFYIKDNGDIISLFVKIYKTLELGYSIDNLLFANMSLSYFLTLFVYNSRHYAATANEKNDCVDSAILYMKENINENISLNNLSSQYNYSVSRFSNLFKQKTGYAPIDYFLQMKMQKACQNLDFTQRSIKDIAFSMGFDDPYYFSKRFRAIIGMSPKKYRSLNKD
jgi:AraC-like DNA-binding protein